MNRIDIKGMIYDDIRFRLSRSRLLYKLDNVLALRGRSENLPFFLFLDEADTASSKYVMHKIKDMENTKIDAIPISITDVYKDEDSVHRHVIKTTIKHYQDKYKTTLIPFIVQVPSERDRNSLFEKYKIYELVCSIIKETISEAEENNDMFKYLDVDFFYNKDNVDIIKGAINRLSGSARSDITTLSMICGDSMLPATPKGIISLLLSIIETSKLRGNLKPGLCGVRIALVGCNSKTTGSYLKEILPAMKATVTLFHSESLIEKDEFKNYDIIISCVGNKGFINADILGVSDYNRILVDVGVSVNNGKVLGDFNTDIRTKGNLYTPYINGVGLLTRHALLSNIILAYERIL